MSIIFAALIWSKAFLAVNRSPNTSELPTTSLARVSENGTATMMEGLLSLLPGDSRFTQLWTWLYVSLKLPLLLSAAVLIALLLLRYSVIIRQSETENGHDEKTRHPPTYASRVPIVGHVLGMAWDTTGFLGQVIDRFKEVPVRLNLLKMDMYVISGSESINAVWKYAHAHNKAYKALAIHNMFRMPKDTLAFWLADNSGIALSPHPNSSVLPHLRVDYLTFSAIAKFLTGPGLKPLVSRFTINLTEQISRNTAITSEWTESADLFPLIQEELLTGVLNAICGPHLLKINPTFVHDFWAFHRHLPALAKGYPRWLFPTPYRLRDRCIESIKRWHTFIRPHFDDDEISSPGHWNPYYGADVIRFRHEAWSKMPLMDADAAATEDLGMIWAGNGNSITSTFWLLAFILRDAALHSHVCEIVKRHCIQGGSQPRFDQDALGRDPYLQSLYAETLRLCVASFLLRSPTHTAFRLRNYCIPTDATMLISGYHAQRDPEAWRPGPDQPPPKPLDEFCPHRFLVFGDGATEPEFSVEERTGSWIPYGGGQRMCPGRYFAKAEMLTSLAVMVTLFEIELMGPVPSPSMDGVGFGALSPDGPLPVRIRRRELAGGSSH